MEIGCVDCMYGCVWHRKKPAIPDDGGGASRQYIRNDVVLYSDTIERRPRQYTHRASHPNNLEFKKCYQRFIHVFIQCHVCNGELQRTWSLPYKYNEYNLLCMPCRLEWK